MTLFTPHAVHSLVTFSGRKHVFNLRWGMKITFATAFSFLLATSISFPALALCPPVELIQEKLPRLTQEKTEVQSIQPSGVPTICEVAVRNGSKTSIFYTDMEGRYFFFGNIIDTVSGSNLTKETLSSLNRFTDQELSDIEALTAFSIGSPADRILYYVTDPQCPYCKRGVEDLKKLAEAGNIQVRFLLFPLQSHKGAKEQCVSVVCDQKGLADFESGYRSKNQCEEGGMLVDATLDLLKKKGINATPTYIFSDGLFHSGLLKMPDLRRRLGLGAETGADG